MDVHVKGGAIDRELRRRQLARRLVFHQARTGTICRLTGLSSHQFETLRRHWRITNEMRRRGRAPTSFAAFRSQAREEAAALAVFWRVFAGVQAPGVPALKMNALEFGECICDVFEAYVACFPSSTLEIEHLLLLVHGLERGDVVAFSKCRACKGVMLVDPLKMRHRSCSHCRRRAALATVGRGSIGGTEPIGESVHAAEPVQLELF